MLRWGLVTTVKAPLPQVLAFIAHHLSLGAARIWVHFDDPDDPSLAPVARLPGVTAIACSDSYWLARKGRPDRHQNRQFRNARETQKACDLDWIGHLDVDEFLHAPRPVAEILAEMPAAALGLRVEPFEAMHDPALPDDIFTARQFRGPLREAHRDLRGPVLGDYQHILPKGHLSHAAGKCFCRPQVRGLQLRLHNVLLHGERLDLPNHPELRLLHFHAQDHAQWRKALPFRLERGAYQYHPELQAHLATADEDEIRRLYLTTQTLTPENALLLERHDRLITADLRLAAKVAALGPG
jgi:hypothetical protein